MISLGANLLSIHSSLEVVEAENPLAVTVTSGSDERKELTFSTMAATLISSSKTSFFSDTTATTTTTTSSPAYNIPSVMKQSVGGAAGVGEVKGSFARMKLELENSIADGSRISGAVTPTVSSLSSSSYSYSPQVDSYYGSWLNKTMISPSSFIAPTTTSSFPSQLSSRLPSQVMALVDPQGIKGPISLSSSSTSSLSAVAASSALSLSSSGGGVGGGADSIMIADESERSATTDFYNNFNSNLSNFINDSGYGNETGLGEEDGSGTYNYLALLLIIFPLVAMFGNVLVILSVKRERTLWNVTNYFIVSLAVADLLVAAVVMPFGVYILVRTRTLL